MEKSKISKIKKFCFGLLATSALGMCVLGACFLSQSLQFSSVAVAEVVQVTGEEAFETNELSDQTIEITGLTDKGITEISDLTIPEQIDGKDVTKIGENAFAGLRITTSLKLPENLKTIGEGAFKNVCFGDGTAKAQTVEVTIPATVTEICDSAFRIEDTAISSSNKFENDKLSIKIAPESQLKRIGAYAFAGGVSTGVQFKGILGHRSLALTIPKNVTEIGDYAFYLVSFSSFDLEDDSQLQTIGDYAFAGKVYKKTDTTYALADSKITSITIPASVTKIGNYAFYLNENLSELKFEEGKESQLRTIGDYAFAGCESTTSTLVMGGNNAYNSKIYSNEISSIKIPKNVTKIGSHAFFDCPSLSVVDFEEESKIEIIDDYAFAGEVYDTYTQTGNSFSYKTDKCSNQISSITIPASVRKIGSHAFYLNTSLNELKFEEGKESQLQTIGDYAFAGERYRSSYQGGYGVSPSSTYATATNKISSITIPKNVTSIGDNAFYACGSLASVEFAQGSVLESIGESAFAGGISSEICPTFTTIKLPDSVETIGAKAFQYCDNLTGQLIISDNVESIGYGAFPDGLEVILPSKAKFEQFSSGFNSENSTYVINIAYKTGSTTTQTDKKLFGKGLDWALVDGVWTSDQPYSLPHGTWYFSDGTQADYNSLNSKMTSKEINDDIELVDIILEHYIEKDENIYATSVNGFASGLTLDVQEVSETGALSDLLQDNFVEGVKKAYVITLRKGNDPYTEVDDLKIYFAKSLAEEYNVYLLSESALQKQFTSSDGYTFNGTSCTIVLKDDSVKITNGFTATLTEGFPEDVEFSVEVFTKVAEMQAKLGEAYNILVQKVYVVELKQGDATYSNEGVSISVPKSFAEQLKVKLLNENELTDCTTETENYTFTGTKFVIALLRDPIPSLSKSGFTATTADDLGFADGVELQVTEITDSAQLAELLGDNYNSLITKAYIVKLVSGEQPIEADGISISVSKDFAEGLNVKLLSGESLVDKEADGENFVFTGSSFTLVLESKEKPAQGLNTTWVIIIGVLTSVGLIAVLLLIIILIIRRKKRKEELDEMQN